MRTYDFISEFNYELPDNTLTITVKGKMYPGTPATQWEPEEGPEIHGEPEIETTGENDDVVDFDDMAEKQQDAILELAVIYHEAIEDDEI